MGPVKQTALNGLPFRMPVSDESKDDAGKASNDDRVRMQITTHTTCQMTIIQNVF